MIGEGEPHVDRPIEVEDYGPVRGRVVEFELAPGLGLIAVGGVVELDAQSGLDIGRDQTLLSAIDGEHHFAHRGQLLAQLGLVGGDIDLAAGRPRSRPASGWPVDRRGAGARSGYPRARPTARGWSRPPFCASGR